MKNYRITVNGNVYDVTVEEGAQGAAPVYAPKAAPRPAAPAPAPAPAAAPLLQQPLLPLLPLRQLPPAQPEASVWKPVRQVRFTASTPRSDRLSRPAIPL